MLKCMTRNDNGRFYLFILFYLNFYCDPIMYKTKLLTSLTLLTNYNDITFTGKAKKIHSNQLLL